MPPPLLAMMPAPLLAITLPPLSLTMPDGTLTLPVRLAALLEMMPVPSRPGEGRAVTMAGAGVLATVVGAGVLRAFTFPGAGVQPATRARIKINDRERWCIGGPACWPPY